MSRAQEKQGAIKGVKADPFSARLSTPVHHDISSK
jgi:hypothetical protein